jgi:hypothetical protein
VPTSALSKHCTNGYPRDLRKHDGWERTPPKPLKWSDALLVKMQRPIADLRKYEWFRERDFKVEDGERPKIAGIQTGSKLSSKQGKELAAQLGVIRQDVHYKRGRNFCISLFFFFFLSKELICTADTYRLYRGAISARTSGGAKGARRALFRKGDTRTPRPGEGRRDRGGSHLIEMALSRTCGCTDTHVRAYVCAYVDGLSLTAVRTKIDYQLELTLVRRGLPRRGNS